MGFHPTATGIRFSREFCRHRRFDCSQKVPCQTLSPRATSCKTYSTVARRKHRGRERNLWSDHYEDKSILETPLRQFLPQVPISQREERNGAARSLNFCDKVTSPLFVPLHLRHCFSQKEISRGFAGRTFQRRHFSTTIAIPQNNKK